MTPTPEQLAAVLPNVSAGIDGGNWTKESARIAWATKVLKWVEEATGDLSAVVDFKIIPEPKPDDVAVFRVTETTTAQEAHWILETLRDNLPCKVIVTSSGVDLHEFKWSHCTHWDSNTLGEVCWWCRPWAITAARDWSRSR